MSRWRIPSRTGGRGSARAEARLALATVFRDMFVTRSLGLGSREEVQAKYTFVDRLFWSARRGSSGRGHDGLGSRAVYQRVNSKSRLATIDSELEDLPLNSARLLYLCLL